MHKLYDSAISGNAYKVRLLLHHLGIPFERIEMNVDDGSTRKPEFLKINPNGKVPALQFPDGRVLFESNAIIFYLALGTKYWPSDRWDQGQAMQWMNFEQYSHEPTVAVVRHWMAHLGKTLANEPLLPANQRWLWRCPSITPSARSPPAILPASSGSLASVLP